MATLGIRHHMRIPKKKYMLREGEYFMLQWTADFGNDPDDDYNLIVIIYYDDVDVAVIKQTHCGLIMRWYPNKEELVIPVDWLSGLLFEAKRRMDKAV